MHEEERHQQGLHAGDDNRGNRVQAAEIEEGDLRGHVRQQQQASEDDQVRLPGDGVLSHGVGRSGREAERGKSR
jgi:hypothetical protein